VAEEEHCFDACKRDDAKARHHEAGRSWTAGLYDNDPYPVPTLTLHSDRGTHWRRYLAMRTLQDASASWQELKRYSSLAELREAVRLDGGHVSPAAAAGLRSAIWKAFLVFESVDTAQWPNTLAASRSAYNSLRTHFLRYVENPDELEGGDDPLNDSPDVSTLCPLSWTCYRTYLTPAETD